MKDSYEDIIDVVWPRKISRPRMSLVERAAQFSPFAALSGYDALIGETARLTDEKLQLDESEAALLDGAMCELMKNPGRKVSVTYFVRDRRKSGGAYLTVSGRLKSFDTAFRVLAMADGTQIPAEDAVALSIED